MSPRHTIPDAALDDRLGFTGTAGSGKTYNAGGAVERILARKGRVVIPDPLGVWWGLRLASDGKEASPYDVVIFGGPHGDLPINEHAGALVGETVARMAESCILDLSQLGTKAAERRFMLAFLTALYRQASGEPVHVVFDEADMWAPQRLMDRDGDAARLLGQMETIVRRGRVKGFIPWLITQRPAVLSKDVLSQVDGLIAFKLTASQDRKALGDWIEGQADREQGKAILASLPEMQRGQGVVWVPARGILETVTFPEKKTFDSSRAPKRGERRRRTAALKPVNIDALKEKLATVEAEVKASDPKALRAEVARLTAELAKAGKSKSVPADPDAIAKAEARGFEQAKRKLAAAAEKELKARIGATLTALRTAGEAFAAEVRTIINAAAGPAELKDTLAFTPPPAAPIRAVASAPPRSPSRAKAIAPAGDGVLTGPQLKLLQALAWWARMGHETPHRRQAAAIAGWKPTGSNLKDRLSELKTRGLVDYPSTGFVTLTEAGAAAAPEPDMSANLIDGVRGVLTGPQLAVFNALLANPGAVARDILANMLGWQPDGSNIKDRLSELKGMEIVTYPSRGIVALADWIAGAERSAAA